MMNSGRNNMKKNVPAIPDDRPLSSKNLKEMRRSFNFINKPSSPLHKLASPIALSSAREFQSPSTPIKVGFKNIRRVSSPKGPNSTIDSFVTSLDPKSSLINSACESKFKMSSEDTQPASKLVTEVPQLSIEDEANFTILPTIEFCPRCMTNRISYVRFKMPTLSFWKRILCVRDAIQCCTNEESWVKYGKYIQECSKCRTVLRIFKTCPL